MKAHLLALLSLAIVGCTSDPGQAPTPPSSAHEAAQTAAVNAANTSELLADIHQFIGTSFSGAIPLNGGFPSFAAPANCTASFSLDQSHISLAADCTLPSGRHVHGSLTIALGGSCGLLGFTVDYDLYCESAPSSGYEVEVKGHVSFKHDLGQMWLSGELECDLGLGGHDVQKKAAGCFMLDLPGLRAAFDGVESLHVDSQEIEKFRITDLQQMLCEWLPFTGSVYVMFEGEYVQAQFDRDTPRTGVVTITTNNSTIQLKLPVPTGGWCTGGAIPTPAMIDYQSCGGCGNPVPPSGSGSGNGNGSGTGSGTGNGNGSGDPIPDPTPVP
jgi:hypothetical protein